MSAEAKRYRVAVCAAAGCLSSHAEATRAALQKGVSEAGLGDQVDVFGTGCLGLCHAGPLVQVSGDDGTRCLYANVQPDTAPVIVGEHLALGQTVEALRAEGETAFFAKQVKIVLEGSGETDPERIETCVARGAYQALQTVVAEDSRRRGRGDHEERPPRPRRRRVPHRAQVEHGPEGERHQEIRHLQCRRRRPGCFHGPQRPRRRSPQGARGDGDRGLRNRGRAGVRLREGRVPAGHRPSAYGHPAGGTRRLSRRPHLRQRVLVPRRPAHRRRGVRLRRGDGAHRLRPGIARTPRPRPPYPATAGLFGHPTLINNVETYANVPAILKNGGDWYASIGTAKSKGTKVFALAGRINRTGLIEVPMGLTLREILFDIGGGIPEGRPFKAAQTGGPSGGCIPAAHLDIPLDYESLAAVGSIMGSGGLIVMDDTSCMVDVAKYFLDFCRSESCGKCVPCRAGTVQMHALLERITRGQGVREDIGRLEELCVLLRETSLCGLGQSAPNPVASTLRYFRDEYEAHIADRYCVAGVCHFAGAEVRA